VSPYSVMALLMSIGQAALAIFLFHSHPWWSGLFTAGAAEALAGAIRGRAARKGGMNS